MTWRPKKKGRNRSVSPKSLRKLDSYKFKARSELLGFAASHPGALSGHFLAMIHEKLAKGSVAKERQLSEASVAQWAVSHSGLKDVRDQREVLTLATVMDAVSRADLAEAMDVLAQRIIAIQSAKSDKGSWTKAEAIELVANVAAGTGSSSFLRLVG